MRRVATVGCGVALALVCGMAGAQSAEPFIGNWALTIPNGGAGWLGVTQEEGYIDASILWGGGSVVPVDSVWVEDETLYVTRVRKVERKGEDGSVIRTHTFFEGLMFDIGDDGTLQCQQYLPRTNGLGASMNEFTGKRIPDLPPKPDLSKVKFGPQRDLLADGLAGWTLTNDRQTNGWKLEDGVLVNDASKKGVAYGNLRTMEEFEDFNLTLDVKVPKDGNSGVYLRGIYEVQVLDSHGKGLDSHHMGAVYSRITPSKSAEKPAGEWSALDMTLVDRHITVKLNGETIIDNEPLLGCTGGALWSDEFRPGPIYLQGDHGPVEYRNIQLREVEK